MPNSKITLNDIIQKFQAIESRLIESDGEISKDIEKLIIDNEEDLSKKLDGYEKFVKYLKGQVEYLKIAEEQYSKRRKVIDNSIRKLKDNMLNALLLTGKDKLKTIENNFSIGESEKWSIDLEKIDDNKKNELILAGLGKSSFQANIQMIKEKYKNENIPLWILVEKNKYLRVK